MEFVDNHQVELSFRLSSTFVLNKGEKTLRKVEQEKNGKHTIEFVSSR